MACVFCVSGLDNLGDVLMTTPAFRALKSTWSRCELTLLTSSAGAAIAEHLPEIDRVIRFDVPWMQTGTDNRGAFLSMTTQLKRDKFDAAILFTVQSQSPLPAALLCYMAGIPQVLGYCRENPYQLMTHWVPDPEVLMATRHEVERQLALVQTVGCHTTDPLLSLRIPEADRQWVQQQLSIANIDRSRPWVILHPGVSEAKRRYPADEFVRAFRQLVLTEAYQLVLTGSATERPLTEAIVRQLGDGPILNLAGQLSIAQLISLIAEAPLLVANNTGPVHIAAAVGTPVVALLCQNQSPAHTLASAQPGAVFRRTGIVAVEKQPAPTLSRPGRANGIARRHYQSRT